MTCLVVLLADRVIIKYEASRDLCVTAEFLAFMAAELKAIEVRALLLLQMAHSQETIRWTYLGKEIYLHHLAGKYAVAAGWRLMGGLVCDDRMRSYR